MERLHDPVCLVDDQTLVRQGIRSLLALAEGIEVVAEAGDGKQAVELIPQVKPDVVLMDMRMPAMSGLEALAGAGARSTSCRRRSSSPPSTTTSWCWQGSRPAPRATCSRTCRSNNWSAPSRPLPRGGSLVQPVVTQRLLSGLEHMRNEFVSLDRPDPLTDRETEILRLMAGGFSNKEIANSLGVAEGTIKNHVSNILSQARRARPDPGRAEGVRAATGLRPRSEFSGALRRVG